MLRVKVTRKFRKLMRKIARFLRKESEREEKKEEIKFPKTPVKIVLDREKHSEIYAFTDLYLYPGGIIRLDEYILRLTCIVPHHLMVLLSNPNMCDAVFLNSFRTKCGINIKKFRDQFLSALEENPEFMELVRIFDDIDLENIKHDFNVLVVDGKILLEPWIILDGDDYKIYLIADLR